MRNRKLPVVLSAAFTAAHLAFFGAARAAAPAPPTGAPVTQSSQPNIVHLTLEEAKQRALSNNKLLNLAALNADSKAFAIKAAQSDYFPKVIGTAMYFHFNDNLGTVLSTQGRTVTGPLGRPLVTFPAAAVNVPILNQNTSFANVGVVQPLTDLLKVSPRGEDRAGG